jgi:hypothetical protein
MSSLANTIWFVVSMFLVFAYVLVMFQIVVDLFRDPEVSGWSKAFWILGLLFVPVITAVVYIVARGKGMAERQHAREAHYRAEAEDYVRHVAGTTSVDQIAKAKTLLETGAINNDEFTAIKQKALMGASMH